jgi:hypothetical protein
MSANQQFLLAMADKIRASDEVMAGVLQHSFDAMQNAYSKQVDLLRDLAEHRHQPATNG